MSIIANVGGRGFEYNEGHYPPIYEQFYLT